MNFTFTGDGNYTFAIGCYNSTNASVASFPTFSGNFTFFLDTTPPKANFTGTNVTNLLNLSIVSERMINFTINESGRGLNLSRNDTINITISLGGKVVKNFTYINDSSLTNISCGSTATEFQTSLFTCNATYNFNSNGTYTVNVTAEDGMNNRNSTTITITVDQIPPANVNFTIANGTVRTSGELGTRLGSFDPSTTPIGLGSTIQGSNITAVANWTDNLTQPFQGKLQFYNDSGGHGWQTINETLPTSTYIAGQNDFWTNFTFFIPIGENNFEGQNVSFRIVANDTLGNSNTTKANITIQINDTYAPRIIINGTVGVNGSNLSTTTVPIISWNVSEHSILAEVNISIDNNVVDTNDCNFFKTFEGTPNGGAASDPERNRNASFATNPSATSICNLANGSHSVIVSARDTWGNTGVVFHNFSIHRGSGPSLSFYNISYDEKSSRQSAANNTNITSQAALNFSSPKTSVEIANFTYTSSCNSTVGVFKGNVSKIKPFGCATGTSSNRTLTLTVTDTAGNSNTTIFDFLVDDIGPELSVNSPTNGFNTGSNGATINNSLKINLSAKDSNQRLAGLGYFVDTNINEGNFNALNLSSSDTGIGGTGENITNTFNLTFKAGTHTIKFSANDTLGNVVNSSILTFTTTGNSSFNLFNLNVTLRGYNVDMSYVNLSNASSGKSLTNETDATDVTLSLSFGLNTSPTRELNVTLIFNASAANWDKYNFTLGVNGSSQAETSINKTLSYIQDNYTAAIREIVWVNESFQEFISNNNSYYAIVKYPINASNASLGIVLGGQFEIWYFKDIKDVSSRKNLTECAANFAPNESDNVFPVTSACWNNTNNRSINVYLPHFSAVAFVNNSGIPTVNVTVPATNITGDRNIVGAIVSNYSIGMFIPNISVSSDTASCVYSINSSKANTTMSLSNGICLGSTERFKNNATGSGGYNLTFTVTDEEGNVNTYFWGFNISDNTPPNSPNETTTSAGKTSTTATITITGMNESVNATVFYATTRGALDSVARETDFNQSQVVSITSLTASTLYHYNVSVCDYNGNCAQNGTFNFTTDAAATTTTTTTTSAGAGGGGAAAPSNVEASAGRQWDNLDAGATAVLTINNDKIAITGVVIEVKNSVSTPSITVESLTSNPYTAPAASKVYQYLQLKKGNIADTDTSKITINFKVAKSWLLSNGVAENDVVLYRYSDNKWSALPTTKTGSDANNVIYESITPGTSTFAIGVKEAPPAAPPEVTPPPEAPVEQPPVPTAEVPAEVPEAPPAPVAKKPISRTTIGWIVVALIVVVAAVGYYVWQKKKSEY